LFCGLAGKSRGIELNLINVSNPEEVYLGEKRVMRASATVVTYSDVRDQRNDTHVPHSSDVVRCGVMSGIPKQAQPRDLTGFAVSISRFWTVFDLAHRLWLMP
jgi:hypothetical protein